MKPFFKYLLLLVVLLCCNYAEAQNRVWKKDLTRLVPIDTSSKKKNEQLLVEMLVAAGQKGEITAYKNLDNFFSFPLTKEEFTSLTRGSFDTITVTDPETGKERLVISERTFNPDLIEKFRLHEQWQFEPIKGRITIQILGLAPVVDIYGEDGNFRATSSICWFKYNDAEHILRKEAIIRPKKNLTSCIWKDFSQDLKVKIEGVQQLNRTRTINIGGSEDTLLRHLRDITPDTTYVTMLRDKINTKNMIAYKDSLLATPYSTDAFSALFNSKPDTIWTIDPETGKQTYKVMPISDFEQENITQFQLLETLTFDPKTGEMTIQIVSVAPLRNLWDEQKNILISVPIFWVKYSDFQTILPAYEVYHPQNTFADKLWQSYFQMPEYIR